MGRSQVLYNRTKGRHRSQGGRGDNTGRGGRGRNEQGGTGSGGRRSRSDANQRDDWKQKTHGNRHSHHHHHQHQQQQQSYGSRGRDYEHEYELLLAGRDTTLGSTKHRHRSDLEDDVDNHSPLGGTTASICLPSMAATLETLSISRRLRMPLHVAASAFPSRFPRPEESKEEEPPPSSGVDDTVDAAAAAAAAAVDDDDDDDDDKDDVCADLEDWLDDACGEPEQPGEPDIAEASAVATTSEPSGFQTRNDETANDAPEPKSKIVEEGNGDGDGDGDDDNDNDNDNEDDNEDDDNLDDWLDSVIE